VPIITLRTFSKLYGLAGLRVGWGVAPAPLVEAIGRIRQPFNVNALALNRDGMASLVAAFRRLCLEHVPSAANFVLVRVGEAARVNQALLRRGVIVRPMDVYGFPAHVRVTVGTRAENERFVEALGAVLG